MSERHFTDQDVAQILQRASELDKQSGDLSLVRGLSLSELEGIAKDVGINPEMVSRAVAELGRSQSGVPRALLGRSTTNHQTQVVPDELSRNALAELVSVVDQSVPAQGTIGEALGSVRWSSSDRILSRQVVLRPSQRETLIRVEERYSDAVRGALHGIPAAYGTVFGLALGLEGIGGIAPGLTFAAILGSSGWALGRMIWNAISRRSRSRVDALTEKLTAEANRLADSAAAPESNLPSPRTPEGAT